MPPPSVIPPMPDRAGVAEADREAVLGRRRRVRARRSGRLPAQAVRRRRRRSRALSRSRTSRRCRPRSCRGPRRCGRRCGRPARGRCSRASAMTAATSSASATLTMTRGPPVDAAEHHRAGVVVARRRRGDDVPRMRRGWRGSNGGAGRGRVHGSLLGVCRAGVASDGTGPDGWDGAASAECEKVRRLGRQRRDSPGAWRHAPMTGTLPVGSPRGATVVGCRRTGGNRARPASETDMSDPFALLVGTPKGAFILEGDAPERLDGCAARCARAGRSTTSRSSPSTGALLAGGGSPWYGPAVWRSDDLGETWTHSSEGLTYGDDGPKIQTRLERDRRPRRDLRGRRAGRPVPERRRRPDLGARRGPDEPPDAPRVAARQRRPDPPLDRPPPEDPDRLWVGISAVGAFETRDGGATWETRNKGVRADFQPDDPTRSSGSASTSSSWPPTAASTCTSRTTAASTAPRTAARQWEEITAGLPVRVRLPDGRPPARPADRLDDPAERRRPGPLHARCDGGRLAHARRRRHVGRSSATGCPSTTPTSGVLREAMAVDRLDPVGVYFGTSTGQVYGSADEGARGRLIADNLPPIWSVEAVARWLTTRAARSSTCRDRSIALFPGAPRRARGPRLDGRRGHRRPRPPGPGHPQPAPRRRPEPSGPTSTSSWPASGPGSTRRSRRAPTSTSSPRSRAAEPSGARLAPGGKARRRRCCPRTGAGAHGRAAGGSPGSRPCGTSSGRSRAGAGCRTSSRSACLDSPALRAAWRSSRRRATDPPPR